VRSRSPGQHIRALAVWRLDTLGAGRLDAGSQEMRVQARPTAGVHGAGGVCDDGRRTSHDSRYAIDYRSTSCVLS
jgi:hypothetical protein